MKDSHKPTFATLINRFLSQKDLSQAELARCIGLDKGTISKWAAPGSLITPRRTNILSLHQCGFTTAEVDQLLSVAGYRPLTLQESTIPATDELSIYLHRIRDKQAILDLSIFQEGQERDFSSVPLEKFYIPLRLNEKGDDILSTQLLNPTYQLGRHLTLLGDAGSGKTTILRHMTGALAHAWLKEDPDFAQKQTGLTQTLLIPLFVPLRYFFHFCQNMSPQRPVTQGSFLEFLPQYFRELHGLTLPLSFYQTILASGRCLLALDGFDEIPHPESRRQIAEVIRDLALDSKIGENFFILSSRIAAYGGSTQLGGIFHTLWVQPLNQKERTAQIKRWVAGITPYTHQPLKTEALLRSIPPDSPLDRLAVTPMIVTTLCVIYFYDHKLPEQRAQLYRRCIDIMLYEKLRPDEPGQQLAKQIGTPDFKRQILARLAFEMHLAQKEEVNKEQAVRWIKDGFKNLAEPERLTAAYDFLDAITTRGVLLQERAGFFGFRKQHLTIREFLAGYHLILGVRARQRAKYWPDLILKDHWHEPIRLAAGTTVFENTLTCEDFLEELLNQSQNSKNPLPTQLVGYKLAAEAIWDLGQTGRTLIEKALQNEIIIGLADRLSYPTITDPTANLLHERVAAAKILGHLGDPREGVTSLPPLLTAPIWRDQNRTEVPTFQGGVYPVTNAQFAQFIEAQGYHHPEWWSEAGWKWRQMFREAPDEAPTPAYWNHERFNNPNQPVIGVSWYEAEAFCQWLTAIFEKFYRLPTELEWKRLAQNPQKNRYPWGDIWHPGLSNGRDSKLKQTVSVGLFPGGVSPIGAHDCLGNVWEWCWDSAKRRTSRQPLLGGSWDDNLMEMGYHTTYNYPPENQYLVVGFRVVSPC